MDDLIGQTIRSYRIEATLGAGGMGQVFRARHVDLNRPVALKVLHANLAADSGFQARFRQEARAIASLRHPHIVEVFDFFEDNGHFYLAMELLEGGSMRTLLRQRSAPASEWSLSRSLELLCEAADALGFAHLQGIVHRDIKPDNMLLARLDQPAAYTLKLSDFGLAYLAEGSVQTASGITMGTPAYISPEQCLGKVVDGRSDLYSLGIVLYEAATGYLPFEVKTLSDAVYKHVHVPPPAPRQVCPELPVVLESIILRCLSKEPGERYATGKELVSALQAVLREQDPRTLLYSVPSSRDQFDRAATVMQSPGSLAAQPALPSLTGRSPVPRIHVVDEQGRQVQTLELTGEGVSVGRLEDNTIALNTDAVSRHHVRVDWDGSTVSVIDLSSSNGTYMDGVRLPAHSPQPWRAGQTLRIGPYWLRLEGPNRATFNTMQEVQKPGPANAVSGPAFNTIPQQSGPRMSIARPIGIVVDPQALKLTPGQPAVLRTTLANLGAQVQHLYVAVDGVPEKWVQLPSQPVQLNPGTQASAALTIDVPREPASRAGEYAVTIRAESRDEPGQVGEAFASLTVLPFAGSSLTISPIRKKAGTQASYTMALSNDGNAPARYTLSASDDEQTLGYQFQESTIALDPGQTKTQPLKVSAQRRWIGSALLRNFTVRSEPEKSGSGAALTDTAHTASGQLDHTALFPAWVPPLLVMAALAVIPLYKLATQPPKPKNTAKLDGTTPTRTTTTGTRMDTDRGGANRGSSTLASPPHIRDFKANPPGPIAPGTPVTLFWTTSSDVTKLEIKNSSNGKVDVTGLHSWRVLPDRETSYTLTAWNKAGSVDSRTTKIEVKSSTVTPQPLVLVIVPLRELITTGSTHTFTAMINGTQSRNVTWRATGGIITDGGRYTAPDKPGPYEITAISKQDTGKIDKVSINVVKAEPASLPITDFKANPPGPIAPGTPVTLFWTTSSDVTKLEIKNSSNGKVDVTGLHSWRVLPDRETSYTLTAWNKAGLSDSRTIQVEVTLPTPPTPQSPKFATGTFIDHAGLSDCLGRIETAMTAAGYTVTSRIGPFRSGVSNFAAVEVSCVPNPDASTEINICAFSSEATTARGAQYQIRNILSSGSSKTSGTPSKFSGFKSGGRPRPTPPEIVGACPRVYHAAATVKSISMPSCLDKIGTVLTKSGYSVSISAGSFRIGSDGSATVEVACSPKGTDSMDILFTALSSDDQTAKSTLGKIWAAVRKVLPDLRMMFTIIGGTGIGSELKLKLIPKTPKNPPDSIHVIPPHDTVKKPSPEGAHRAPQNLNLDRFLKKDK